MISRDFFSGESEFLIFPHRATVTQISTVPFEITILLILFLDGYDDKTIEMIRFLVEKSEGNVNTKSDAGYTPLHLVSWTPNGAQLIPLFAKVCESIHTV